ncbi:hypothetical protein FKM82_000266 [Ascaphus truei]
MKSKARNVHGSQSSFASLQVTLHGCVLLLLLQKQILCYCSGCHVCTGRQANCRGLGLTSIPRNFPRNITFIYLSGNNITHINPNEFRDLQKLAVLFLSNSSVCYVHPRAFASLNKLYYLYLNDNYIKRLDPGIFEGLSDLHYLHLQHNQIAFLPQGLFGHLGAVRYLSLQRNRLRVLASDTFFGMISLHTLNLANNNISRISDSALRYLENLEHLYLEGNDLMQVPSHALGLLKNLKRLLLSNNPLRSIHNFAFRGLDSLQYLFLNNANIQIINAHSFYGLNNLEQLILSKNELKSLDYKMFTFLNHLLYLHLDRNDIVTISDNTFKDMGASLKVLNLAFNNLTFLQPKVLQPLVSLTHFQANYNPWDCGCQFLGIRNFLLSSSFTFSLHCQNPPQLRGRPLRNVNWTEFENCLTISALSKSSKYENLATTRTIVWYNHMTNVTYKPFSDANGDNILTSTKSAFRESTSSDLSHKSTELPLLHVQIPPQLAPVNLTKVADNVLPPDASSMSRKPYVICQQQFESLNQSFHILLSFFILSCAAIIFLFLKVIQLKRKLTSENRGESVLEYYSCYQSGRYQITDPIRVTPQNHLQRSEINLIEPLKHIAPETRTQVILFEHSVL